MKEMNSRNASRSDWARLYKVESQFKSHHLVLEMLVDSRRMQGGLDLFQKLLTLNTYLTQ